MTPASTDTFPPETITRAALIGMVAMLVLVLWKHLLPALLAGLLIHELVYLFAPVIMQYARIKRRPAKIAVVTFLTIIVITLLAAMLTALIYYFRTGDESLPALLKKMAEILESSRKMMPAWLAGKLPPDADSIKAQITEWLRVHASEIQAITKDTLRVLAHIIIGMIIGAMIAMFEVRGEVERGKLTQAIFMRTSLLAQSFRQVVFAQVRIAAINAVFTAIYLVIILPLFGIKLPFLTMMIVLTFLFGLLPVLGNLMSNTVIVIVSLSHSPGVAMASLAYLVIIHKLEYFLNARIIGSRIQTRAFEILIAMLFLETLFGVAGVIAAPIYYAYIKKELKQAKLV